MLLLLFTTDVDAQRTATAGKFKNVDFHVSQLITRDNLLAHLQVLASDSLEGREFGTFGINRAADYIVSRLHKAGVKPMGGRGTYFQPVTVNTWKWKELSFRTATEKMTAGLDYAVRFFDNKNKLALTADHMMYIGYGINDLKYNDYAFAQGWNEVLLMLDGEPKKGNNYLISGTDQPSAWSKSLDKKMALAVAKNAKAILLIQDAAYFKKEIITGQQKSFSIDTSARYPIPVIRINKNSLGKIFAPEELKKLQQYLEFSRMGKISSNYVSGKIDFRSSVENEVMHGRNVIAWIEGADQRKKYEWLILSGHYDHLGITNGEVNNGADDNGTGTAALIEIAAALQRLRNEGRKLDRSILIVFFTAEEKGLLGSKFFAENPVIPLRMVKANINIDMIGRSDDLHEPGENYIYSIGADKINPILDEAVQIANDASVHYKLDYTYNDEAHPSKLYYRSDHYSFASKGIPSVFLFGGFHEDYHMPTDDIEKIDLQKVQDVARMVYFALIQLAGYPVIQTQYR